VAKIITILLKEIEIKKSFALEIKRNLKVSKAKSDFRRSKVHNITQNEMVSIPFNSLIFAEAIICIVMILRFGRRGLSS